MTSCSFFFPELSKRFFLIFISKSNDIISKEIRNVLAYTFDINNLLSICWLFCFIVIHSTSCNSYFLIFFLVFKTITKHTTGPGPS